MSSLKSVSDLHLGSLAGACADCRIERCVSMASVVEGPLSEALQGLYQAALLCVTAACTVAYSTQALQKTLTWAVLWVTLLMLLQWSTRGSMAYSHMEDLRGGS